MNSVMLDSLQFSLSKDALIERIGGDSKKPSTRLINQTKHAIKTVNEHAQARAMYKLVDCENNSCFDQDMFYDSKKVSRVFRGCDSAAVFLVTMGYKVDELIQDNLNKQPAFGYLLDTAASMAAESAVDILESMIEEHLPEEQGMTERYSPGYCDWPLQGQKSLLDIIPYENLNVQLNENYSMTPRKSVSGIIGICPATSADASGNACRYCGKKECPYRRI